MKTKSLYPILVSEDIEGTINFYSTVLDYSVKHNFAALSGAHVIVLSNPHGDEIELIEKIDDSPIKLPVSTGLFGFRINVDDIEEAKKEAEKSGCTVMSEIHESETGKGFIIKDNNGVSITLMQHIRKD